MSNAVNSARPGKCSFELAEGFCGKRAIARGFCGRHYKAMARRGAFKVDRPAFGHALTPDEH